MNKENNFDFIRFVAATLVIVSHSVALTGNGVSYTRLLTNGQIDLGSICVCVFFIVSGYLICNSYLRLNDFSKFMLFRILRIFPALLALLCITIFLIGPIVTSSSLSVYFSSLKTYTYFKNITLYLKQYELTGFDSRALVSDHLSTNGSLWTLRVEFSCYILVGLLGYLNLLNKKAILIISVALMLLFIPYIVDKNFMNYNYKLVTLILLVNCFCAGCVFNIFKDVIKFNHLSLLFIAVVSLIIACFTNFLLIFIPYIAGYVVLSFAFSNKIKLYRFGKYGDFSYGIYIYGYLIQQIIIMFFNGQMTSTLNYIIAIPIAIVCGLLSYHLVEEKCLKFKKIFNL